MNHLTLFQLTATITAIVDDIIDAQINSDEEEIQSLLEELGSLYGARSEKHEGYVHVIKNAEAAAKSCHAEAEAFAVRSRALKNLAQRLKNTLLADLHQHNEKTTTAGKFQIRRQNGQPRLVVRIEAAELPEEYKRVTIEADKTALKDALKAGDIIDGVELQSTEHIRIRVK